MCYGFFEILSFFGDKFRFLASGLTENIISDVFLKSSQTFFDSFTYNNIGPMSGSGVTQIGITDDDIFKEINLEWTE